MNMEAQGSLEITSIFHQSSGPLSKYYHLYVWPHPAPLSSCLPVDPPVFILFTLAAIWRQNPQRT